MTRSEQRARAHVPQWYLEAIGTTARVETITVDNVQISTRGWGNPNDDGIILAHGGAAHARWWDHIGPILASHHHVIALDLSGHGDSGYRQHYSLDSWAAEVLAVARSMVVGPATLVGHSMGGLVSLRAAALAGDELSGLIVVDTPIAQRPPEELAASDKIAFGPKRVYPTREAAVARFRAVPAQDTLDYIEEYIAENSVRPNGTGWSWKFDPNVFARPFITSDVLTRLACRVAFFRAELGMVDSAMERQIYDGLGRVAPVIEIPTAAHHVMLDQPIALVTGIRTLLGEWEHSLPLT